MTTRGDRSPLEPSAAVALADALDAEGRHTEAIAALSRAAQAGDAAAQARVGFRILTGDRAPLLPEQGAGLLDDAARAGEADAALMVAVLSAAGIYRRQSWSEAFDMLQRAAELGSASAREQIMILSGDPPAGTLDEADSGVWRSLRTSFDLQSLLAPPPGETLCDDPLIRRFGAFATPAACAWLIRRGGERLTRAQVYDSRGGADEVNETRTNSLRIFNLVETDLIQLMLQHRMAAATKLPFSHMEALSVLHYAEGQQISDHYDFIDPRTPGYDAQIARDGQRMVTFLVYLNDDYEGGETEFPRLGVRHKGARGEGLFFTNALPSGAADVRSLHAGRPPTCGEKWIVSQFIRSRPFVPGVAER